MPDNHLGSVENIPDDLKVCAGMKTDLCESFIGCLYFLHPRRDQRPCFKTTVVKVEIRTCIWS